MLAYACVSFLIVAVSCETLIQTQNQVPRLLVTPNQLASGALLRLQQNLYTQPGGILYNPNQPETLDLRSNFQGIPSNPGTTLKLQNLPGQPRSFLYDSIETVPRFTQGAVEFPAYPNGIVQKLEDRDSLDENSKIANQKSLENQSIAAQLAPNSFPPRTLLRVQQIPSAQPGVVVSFPRQSETEEDTSERQDGTSISSKNDSKNGSNNRKTELVKPSQVPLGKLIRLQQNPLEPAGVFLYNPTKSVTTNNRDVEAGKEERETPTTMKGLDAKEAREEVTDKSPTSQKSTEDNRKNGEYYIYHPSGLLQKVTYSTKDDVANMAFMASLKYKNVEPIREPIYTYDPKTFVFRRV